jgi:anti-sigma regulatory factor (Ser/Thr protein kinase)
MTSELATNAILHSASGLPGGTFTVSVSTIGGSLRVGVIDQGGPAPRAASPRGLGYGLALVSLLADDYGTGGRDRWFALPAGGAL